MDSSQVCITCGRPIPTAEWQKCTRCRNAECGDIVSSYKPERLAIKPAPAWSMMGTALERRMK